MTDPTQARRAEGRDAEARPSVRGWLRTVRRAILARRGHRGRAMSDLPADIVDAARMIAGRLRDPRTDHHVDRQLLDEAADLLEDFASDTEHHRRRLLDEHHADREIDAAMEAVADDPEDEGGGR